MKKHGFLGLFFALFMSVIMLNSTSILAATDVNHPGFRVEGRFLYDNQGEKTILYGINKMVVWMDKDGDPSFSEIAKTGANCVRIVWTMKDGTAAELDKAITNCRSEHMIPMVELHDATGNFSQLSSLVDWWVDPATVEVIKKHQEYLLINIGNEVGDGNVSDATFKESYIEAVIRMREAGIHVPLIIDGSSWGQDINKLQACGPDILAADPDANLMFSAHLWWPYMYGHTAQEVIDELTETAEMGLPLVVGEFANQWEQTEQGQIPYKTIMEYCAKYEIGYLIWSWGPGNSPQTFLDMTTDGTFDTMQDWAKEMVFDDKYALANLVQRPASMLTGLPASLPEAPLAAGNLAGGKAVTYSTKEGAAYEGSNVTDGNMDTRWASDANSQTDWIMIDLGETKEINKVLIDWENAYATQYQIQVSDDKETWKDAYRTYNGKGGLEEIAVDATGRYVRIYCTQKYGYTWGYSIFEVGIYGPESELSASVTPTIAVFDKNVSKQEDLVFTLDSKTNTLVSVKNKDVVLKADKDYVVSGNQLTITKAYLSTLEKGKVQLTLVYDAGVNPVINIAIGDTSPIVASSNSVIAPTTATFEKKAPSEVKVEMTLNENTLTAILNGAEALVEGKDYTVEGSTVTISEAYLMSLATGKANLTFVFSAGVNRSLMITVTNTVQNASVSPSNAIFDKAQVADITANLDLKGNTLTAIKNGEITLVAGEDYRIVDDQVTFKADYLATLERGNYTFAFEFNEGEVANLIVKVINSAEKDSVVTPNEVIFDKYVDSESGEVLRDVNLNIAFNGNTLEAIKLDDTVLVADEDYVVTSEGVTFPVSYLMSLANGNYELKFDFSAGEMQVVTLVIKETTPVAEGAISVELTSNSSVSTNTLSNNFKLQVTDESEFDLSKLDIRYYFTAEDMTIGQTCWIDNASIQYTCDPWYMSITSNVTANIVKMDVPTETANTYLSLTFDSGAQLNQAGKMEIATRTANNNWSNFDQSNDFSCNDATKVAVFYDGKLISGSMPR
nr:X2-like carbohydrate binding domain-containing protein [uncultured Cellulosilyticum sp.]